MLSSLGTSFTGWSHRSGSWDGWSVRWVRASVNPGYHLAPSTPSFMVSAAWNRGFSDHSEAYQAAPFSLWR